jgi:hypothetical protein
LAVASDVAKLKAADEADWVPTGSKLMTFGEQQKHRSLNHTGRAGYVIKAGQRKTAEAI